MSGQVEGAYRVRTVRYQDVAGRGAVVVTERLDEEGRAQGDVVLRIPGRIASGGRPLHVGQTIQVGGRHETWRDPRTGGTHAQVAVDNLHEVAPHGAAWITYVAGNPLFHGVGQATAERVWDALGEGVYDLLDGRDAACLLERAPCLTPAQAHTLVTGWAECGQARLVRWLERHRMPRALCRAILRAYVGEGEAVQLLDADPYRLIAFGQTWKRVDALARDTFGVAEDDPRRLHAAVTGCLMDRYGQGHTAAAAADLVAGVREALGCDERVAHDALGLVFGDGGFVLTAPDLYQLRGVHGMERHIARDLARRCAPSGQLLLDLGHGQALAEYEGRGAGRVALTARQREGVLRGVGSRFSVILGGAGTGKTTGLSALVHVAERVTGRRGGVLLMALAGRAAQRMSEATGREAVTIAGFLHTVREERLAETTHVVIDEASMLDVADFYAVVRKLRGRANLVLVGDPCQLPPVGAGKVLHLVAERADMPVTVLDQVWRQADGNSIREVATAVRSGSVPDIPDYRGPREGVSIAAPGADLTVTAGDLFVALGGTASAMDVCVLVPRRTAGPGSAVAVNRSIHGRLLADAEPVLSPDGVDTGFSVGDRLVCDVNNWDVDMMNGTLGYILRTPTPEESDAEAPDDEGNARASSGPPVAVVAVQGGTRLLGGAHLRDCSWGYALTCHRAQGSEFQRVVVVLDDRMDRSWLYTALTRGRGQVVLVGTRKQFERAILTAPQVDERRVALDVHLTREMGDAGRAARG